MSNSQCNSNITYESTLLYCNSHHSDSTLGRTVGAYREVEFCFILVVLHPISVFYANLFHSVYLMCFSDKHGRTSVSLRICNGFINIFKVLIYL